MIMIIMLIIIIIIIIIIMIIIALGMLEIDKIMNQTMKVLVQKEFLRRLKKFLNQD